MQKKQHEKVVKSKVAAQKIKGGSCGGLIMAKFYNNSGEFVSRYKFT